MSLSHAFLLDFSSAPAAVGTLDSIESDKAYFSHLFHALRPGALGMVGCAPAGHARAGIALRLAGFELKDALVHATQTGKNTTHWLAQKPLEGTYADTAVKHGCGALNVDGCRVGSDDTRSVASGTAFGLVNDDSWQPRAVVAGSACGRFPANLILDGSSELINTFPRTGPSKASAGRNGQNAQGVTGMVAPRAVDMVRGHNDNGGSAARFFQHCPTQHDLLVYLAKLLLVPGEPRILVGGLAEAEAADAAGWPKCVPCQSNCIWYTAALAACPEGAI